MEKGKRFSAKNLTIMALLAAIAYVVMYLAHLVPFFAFVPSLPFLKYDPKDVIIAIAGFMMGPLEALAITVVVSLLEMITVSTTGIIGFVMNVLSTAAFVIPASVIYMHRRRMSGAILGLAAGVICMTAVMLLWNYLITPLYMNISREMLVGYLLPGFLPFNLLKAAINMALTLLLYKPVMQGLRRAKLLPKRENAEKKKGDQAGVIILAAVLLITSVLVVLVLRGVL